MTRSMASAPSTSGRIQNLRTLAVIFPIKVGLFVRADSPIKTSRT